jgi:nifR3 family TIM-barrel protein
MPSATAPLAPHVRLGSRPSLSLSGRDGTRTVRFPLPLLLAPMEGITDPVFRDLVIALGGVGGACSEFIRISVSAMSAKVVRRYLGEPQPLAPVGVQFMAADEEHLPASIAAAERVGAPWIDLNFGCPVPVVFNKCAGSALLGRPEVLARIVRSAVVSTALPVSAKIRAGIDSPTRLREIVAAVIEAGAAMLTVHARLRCQPYSHPATWEWLALAREERDRHARRIPLIGNGGIDGPQDVARLLDETGCDGAMIGRAALADPWIFAQADGGPPPSAAQAADFALRYADAVAAVRGERGSLAKLKQLVRYYRAGGLFDGAEDQRTRLLRSPDLAEVRAWFGARRQGSA